MKAAVDTIKIEINYEDCKELKTQLSKLIHDLTQADSMLGGFFDESHLRELYPKVNELLNILNVRDDLPF